MKNLKTLTTEFLLNVKSELDSGSVDYQYSNNCSHIDCENAIAFLESTTFSLMSIKQQLKESWEDIIYNMRSEKITENKEGYAAKMIFSRLADNRITALKMKGDFETVTFVLN